MSIQHDLLFNKMKAAADSAVSRQGQNRWGLISSTRQTDTGYEVKVMVQPENVLSGWLPVVSPMVGAGWGIVCPPSQGMQAFIAPDCGDHNHGVVLGMTYSTSAMPPQPGNVPVKDGQFALVHKNGSYLVFNDDDVLLVTNRDLSATVKRNLNVSAAIGATVSSPSINIAGDGAGGNTTITVTGDLLVSGQVVAGNGGGDQVSLQTHRHGTGNAAAGTSTPTPGT